MINLRVLQTDITTVDADAIVNAANERMLGGGGVDGAIHRAAGPELRAACAEVPEIRPGVRCPTGEARTTPGFKLPAKYVVHTVGPVWSGGSSGEPELLASCYRNALGEARKHGARTVAFPAISCGLYGYPPDKASEVAVKTIREQATDDDFDEVYLVAFDGKMAAILKAAARV